MQTVVVRLGVINGDSYISYPDVFDVLLELDEGLEDAILLDLYEVCGLDLV